MISNTNKNKTVIVPMPQTEVTTRSGARTVMHIRLTTLLHLEMKRALPFYCGIFFLLFAVAIPTSPNPAVAQVLPQPKLTRITVTISPPKATVFAGETQIFVATVLGGADKTVTWSVAEEDGGTVTNQACIPRRKFRAYITSPQPALLTRRNRRWQPSRCLPIATHPPPS